LCNTRTCEPPGSFGSSPGSHQAELPPVAYGLWASDHASIRGNALVLSLCRVQDLFAVCRAGDTNSGSACGRMAWEFSWRHFSKNVGQQSVMIHNSAQNSAFSAFATLLRLSQTLMP